MLSQETLRLTMTFKSNNSICTSKKFLKLRVKIYVVLFFLSSFFRLLDTGLTKIKVRVLICFLE